MSTVSLLVPPQEADATATHSGRASLRPCIDRIAGAPFQGEHYLWGAAAARTADAVFQQCLGDSYCPTAGRIVATPSFLPAAGMAVANRIAETLRPDQPRLEPAPHVLTTSRRGAGGVDGAVCARTDVAGASRGVTRGSHAQGGIGRRVRCQVEARAFTRASRQKKAASNRSSRPLPTTGTPVTKPPALVPYLVAGVDNGGMGAEPLTEKFVLAVVVRLPLVATAASL